MTDPAKVKEVVGRLRDGIRRLEGVDAAEATMTEAAIILESLSAEIARKAPSRMEALGETVRRIALSGDFDEPVIWLAETPASDAQSEWATIFSETDPTQELDPHVRNVRALVLRSTAQALREGGDVGLETTAEERAWLFGSVDDTDVETGKWNTPPSERPYKQRARADVIRITQALERDIDKLLARTGQGEPQTGDMMLVPRELLNALDERDLFLNPSSLEEAAKAIDCDGNCEHIWRESDVNASGCRLSDRGKYCPNDVAETLRALAKVSRKHGFDKPALFAPQTGAQDERAAAPHIPDANDWKPRFVNSPVDWSLVADDDLFKLLICGMATAEDQQYAAGWIAELAHSVVQRRMVSAVALASSQAAGAAEATAKIVGWLRSLQSGSAKSFADAIQAGEHLKEKG